MISTAIKYYYADTGQPPKGPCTVKELKSYGWVAHQWSHIAVA